MTPDKPWFIRLHAMGRMKEMGVDREEVLDVIRFPDTDYPSPKKYPGCRVAVSERLAVCYDPMNKRVITVIWNRQDRTRPPLPDHDDLVEGLRGDPSILASRMEDV